MPSPMARLGLSLRHFLSSTAFLFLSLVVGNLYTYAFFGFHFSVLESHCFSEGMSTVMGLPCRKVPDSLSNVSKKKKKKKKKEEEEENEDFFFTPPPPMKLETGLQLLQKS